MNARPYGSCSPSPWRSAYSLPEMLIFSWLSMVDSSLRWRLLPARGAVTSCFSLPASPLLFGFFVRCYQLVLVQTGFASTDLLRLRALVLYPDTERVLFLVAFAGVAFALPVLPVASGLLPVLESASRPGRLAVGALSSLAGSYLLFRLVLPICKNGAFLGSDIALSLAIVTLGYAALAPGRLWARLVVGHQALVLVGIFSFQEPGVIGAALQMLVLATGVTGLALSNARALLGFSLCF